MVLNLRIIGVVAGLTALSQLGYIMMRILVGSDDDDRRSGAALALVGLVVFLGGLGGVLIARIIQASVSRQREYLADAASVQFTRNPLGLAGALKKAGGMASLPHESVAASLETQHMYFVSVPSFYEKVFSTHPPIEDRVKRIDPTFNGVIPPFVAKVDQPVSAPPSVDEIASQAMKSQLAAAVVVASATPVRRGYPSDLDIQSAVGFHGELPPVLRDATREPVSAMGLVLAMVLRRDPTQRAEQLKVAQAAAGGEVVQEALRLELLLRDLPAGSRVPLLDLALPTLREMSSYQLQVFRGSLHRAGYQPGEAFVVLLIESMMHRYLGLEFKLISSAQAIHVDEAAGLILSAVVQTSSESPEDRVAAYQRGVAVAGFAGISSAIVEHALTDLARLEEALLVLTTMNVASRRNFVRACGMAVLYDNQAEPAEVEILRAVSDAIGISLATGLEH
jgi:hypothetical protein